MRRRASTWILGLALGLFLVAFAGFAWLTHHPEAEWLAAIVERPVVGPLAAAFRRRYLPPARPPVATAADPALPAPADPRTRDGGGNVERRIAGEAQPFVWVPAGAELRAAPDLGAARSATLSATRRLTRLEQRGDWYRVRFGDLEGWAFLPGYDETSSPPLGSDPEPVRPVTALPPDPPLLAAAREHLAVVRERLLGPYSLHTDVTDQALLARLAQVAGHFEDDYRRRIGRTPIGVPAEAVVLFAQRRAYEDYKEAHTRLTGLRSEGHVSQGLVAICRGGRSASAVEDTLVHELSHLLNRRAIGPALPPWLDEGIADALAEARRDAGGRIEPGTIGGEISRPGGGVVELEGGWATLQLLREASISGGLRSLPELLRLDWDGFVEPARAPLHYGEAAFFVRYLLDGDGAAWRAPFHAFLAAVADGASPDLATLSLHLGRGPREVELGFRVWLAFQTRAEVVSGTASAATSRKPDSAG